MSKKIVTERYQVDKKKFELAEKKVTKLLEDMFGTDYDGDPNVQFVLIDRERNTSFHFRPVPYSHKTKTSKEMLQVLDDAYTNLRIAQDLYDSEYKIYRYMLREEEKKNESRNSV